MITRVAILLCICWLAGCSSHPNRNLREKMVIYPLSPFEVWHTEVEPTVIYKFLIIEGHIKDMRKAQDTVKMYLDSLGESFVRKTDPITSVLVYEADEEFNHTYQHHPDLLGTHDDNFVLQFSYRYGELKYTYYILHDNQFYRYSKTPPPLRSE